MIEPSSSEEDEDEVPDSGMAGQRNGQTQAKNLAVPNGKAARPGAVSPNVTDGGPQGKKENQEKVTSPTMSPNSEKNLTEAEIQEKHAKEEEERKRRIQLYVFVLRCVAYNFNAKQPNDMQKRHLKVTKEGHEKMKAKIEVKGKRLTFWLSDRVTLALIEFSSHVFSH